MSNQTEIRHSIGADGTLALRSISGSIKLTGGDTDEAVVVTRGGYSGVPDLNVERSPGRLVVELKKDGLSFMRGRDMELEFDVILPRNARVDVKSVSAD